jgi:hypothetical protein
MWRTRPMHPGTPRPAIGELLHQESFIFNTYFCCRSPVDAVRTAAETARRYLPDFLGIKMYQESNMLEKAIRRPNTAAMSDSIF